MPNNFLDIQELNRPAWVGFSRASDEQLTDIWVLPWIPTSNPSQNKVKWLSAVTAPVEKTAMSRDWYSYYKWRL